MSRPAVREHQILALYAAGDSARLMGLRLGIEESTVKEYMRRLRKRYGVSTRAELVEIALQAPKDSGS